MKNKLTMLLNTLADIETKGDSTLKPVPLSKITSIKMALCMQHIQQMIAECEIQEKTPEQNKDKK